MRSKNPGTRFTPDLSIVTGHKGQLSFLRQCIASVSDQQGVNVEHLIFDAETPGWHKFQADINHDFPERADYKRLLVSEPDSGLYAAVNRGLRKCHAPICAYLNADEQYLEGALDFVKKTFQSAPNLDILWGTTLVVNLQGALVSARYPVSLSPDHILLCHLPVFTASMFFSRRLLNDASGYFDEGWRDVGDADWVARQIGLRRQIKSTAHPLSTFTDTGENSNLKINAASEAKKLKEQVPWLKRKLWLFYTTQHLGKRLVSLPLHLKPIQYSLYISPTSQVRTTKIYKLANPFWPGRWFVRARRRLASKTEISDLLS